MQPGSIAVPAKIPAIARISGYLALLMAASNAFTAVTSGPIIILPAALIPLMGGIGILKGRAWSAYGLALVSAISILTLPIVWIAEIPLERNSLISLAGGSLLLAPLFFMAGRALARAGTGRGRARYWIGLAVFSALAPLAILKYHAYALPTGSMEDTLLAGDRLITRVWGSEMPVLNDVIVFRYPVDHKQTFVKRIVGVPGDRLRLVNKALMRNGVTVREPWVRHRSDFVDMYRDNFPGAPAEGVAFVSGDDMLKNHVTDGEVIVPQGKYFVMGDNRDQSLDSRYWGFVDRAEIIGRPVMIYDSRETETTHVRWERLFKLL
ncbi:MAG TPA: signal peptidase I [Bryobacteraceae bacterium]|nr:signal peptidase I [Bryobacteraceae bacterium]